MKNDKIYSYLVNQRDEYRNAFQAFSKKESILEEVYVDVEHFNFEEYKNKLEMEIRQNVKEWWINPEKGIVKEEELFAILFEYDHFYAKDVEALSYGIGKWKNYKVRMEEFDMGYDYDFTTEFYAAPGITLNFFDALEKLDDSNLPEQYKEDGMYDCDGFYELIELFKMSGMIAIHEVLVNMDSNKEFEGINYKNDFMMIIDEHDSGEVYPLLIKEKK